MVDRNDQTDVSEATKAQEALLHDVDPSLTDANDVAKALNVDPPTGLSTDEAKRRLEKFGPNELASAPPEPPSPITVATIGVFSRLITKRL